MTFKLAPLAAFSLLAFTPACAQQDSGTPQNREEIEEIVRDYILQNPEIIEEALIELQRRARQREQDAMLGAVTGSVDQLYGDARDP